MSNANVKGTKKIKKKWSKEENIKNVYSWLPRKVELIELKDYQQKNKTKTVVNRGGIFNVELGIDNIGGEKNKTRPCLVISANRLNNGETVVIIPLSTKFKYAIDKNGEKKPEYHNHYVLLQSKYSFLREDSCIKVEDVRSVDKVRINELLGNIDPDDLKLIRRRVLFTFGY